MRTLHAFGLVVAVLMLASCSSPEHSRPDQRVGVMQNPATGKMMAMPRVCPQWHQHIGQGLENEFAPQFGCADSYNLGMMIDRPDDLVRGRAPEAAEAAPGVLGIERYRSGKTKQLMNPKDGGASSKN